jgi:hypothetical protein
MHLDVVAVAVVVVVASAAAVVVEVAGFREGGDVLEARCPSGNR